MYIHVYKVNKLRYTFHTVGESMLYNAGWKKEKPNEEGKVSKIEGQVWFGLRELLLNPKCAPYYEITEHRLSQLLKVLHIAHRNKSGARK